MRPYKNIQGFHSSIIHSSKKWEHPKRLTDKEVLQQGCNSYITDYIPHHETLFNSKRKWNTDTGSNMHDP